MPSCLEGDVIAHGRQEMFTTGGLPGSRWKTFGVATWISKNFERVTLANSRGPHPNHQLVVGIWKVSV